MNPKDTDTTTQTETVRTGCAFVWAIQTKKRTKKQTGRLSEWGNAVLHIICQAWVIDLIHKRHHDEAWRKILFSFQQCQNDASHLRSKGMTGPMKKKKEKPLSNIVCTAITHDRTYSVCSSCRGSLNKKRTPSKLSWSFSLGYRRSDLTEYILCKLIFWCENIFPGPDLHFWLLWYLLVFSIWSPVVKLWRTFINHLFIKSKFDWIHPRHTNPQGADNQYSSVFKNSDSNEKLNNYRHLWWTQMELLWLDTLTFTHCWSSCFAFSLAASKYRTSSTCLALSLCHMFLFWGLYFFWYIGSLFSTFWALLSIVLISSMQTTFNCISLLSP